MVIFCDRTESGDDGMKAWLGVVSAEHVRRGVALGIAQIGHGKRSGLARMAAGDRLVYYSARERLGGPSGLRSFTAIGRIPDDEIWQGEDGDFRPFRRRVEYETRAGETPIGPLLGSLDLTASPNWGYQLRRGLLPLTAHDFRLIERAMVV